MKYNYTAYHKTDDERIKAIEEDILSDYPRLGELAMVAASMEEPFGRVHEDYELFSNQENEINRLIDIVIVTEGKDEYQEEYRKACNDLEESYQSWKRNFPYANPKEQSAYVVMQRFYEHQKDKKIPLITFKEAKRELRIMQNEKDIKMKSERLKEDYPMLGEEITNKVARDESESNIWLRFQENDIVRLVSIIKLIESKKQYEEAYVDCLKKLKEMYEKWYMYETRGSISSEQEMVIEMMKRFKEHLEDKNNPIVTYAEIKEEEELKKKSRSK